MPKIQCLLLIFLLFNFVYAEDISQQESKSFEYFESTAYKERTAMYSAGFVGIEEIATQFLWDKNKVWNVKNVTGELPPRKIVCDFIKRIDKRYEWVILDIEHWPLNLRRASREEVEENLSKYIQVVKWARQCGPNFKFGYYAQVPIGDHEYVLKESRTKEKIFWEEQHLNLLPFVEHVDALFPSLYTAHTDPEKWEILANEYIRIARKIAGDKPVYAYLWPMYHPGVKGKKDHFVEGAYWKKQLQVTYDLADGIVLWGGWNNGPMDWDENAEWWQVTKKFVNENR